MTNLNNLFLILSIVALLIGGLYQMIVLAIRVNSLLATIKQQVEELIHRDYNLLAEIKDLKAWRGKCDQEIRNIKLVINTIAPNSFKRRADFED